MVSIPRPCYSNSNNMLKIVAKQTIIFLYTYYSLTSVILYNMYIKHLQFNNKDYWDLNPKSYYFVFRS